MIALFDEAFRVSINEPDQADGSRQGLLLGLLEDGKGVLSGIVLLEDGHVTRLAAQSWTIDFRYDVESDRWIDQAAQQPPQ